MILSLKIILLTLLFISLSSPGFPGTYKWKDKNGNTVYSDTLPPGVDAKKMEPLKKPETPTEKGEGVKTKEGIPNPPNPNAPQPNERKGGPKLL